jgi:predicted Zn-dependent protease with MMP-like domain
MWVTMYPLPRVLIAAALLVAVGYAIVAALVLAPPRASLIGYLWGLPVLLAIGIAIFAHGEPSDQTAVHQPGLSETHLPKLSERQLDALEDQVERLARDPRQPDRGVSRPTRDAQVSHPVTDEAGFIELVQQAIDELPAQFADALDHVGVVVSDQGSVQRINGRLQPLYGLYIGYAGRGSVIGAPARSALPDRIVIFRDTLVHDYGNNPGRLRAEVARTLRHELGHHLGWDEKGVRALGL